MDNLSFMKSKILNYVMEELGATDMTDIVDVETNAGGIWITLSSGEVKSISIIDCEPNNEEYIKSINTDE